MVTAGIEIKALLNDNQPLTDEQFNQLVTEVRRDAVLAEQFRTYLESTLKSKSNAIAGDGALAMKAAQGLYALCDFAPSLSWAEKAGNGKSACLLKARILRKMKDFAGAIRFFEQAENKGHDNFDTAMNIADCQRRLGQLDQAKQKLDQWASKGDIRAEYHFQRGRLDDAMGRHEESIDEYEKAIALDPNHIEALFCLAYALDLYGQEEQAISYYERCLSGGSCHISACLNLAVLYEDKGQYDKAERYVQRVLYAHPTHERARMFLKDIQASRVMYYDEDQERRVDQRNQVLQIPISDFELSVRSRNCLKKMNIRTLGDLLKVTESELLAYKNFGETSLQEIKAILNSKNLRLGQLLEDRNHTFRNPLEEEPKVNDEQMATPVGELELSVRSRKGLQRLNILTLGDLVNCTEAELLGCKNFGMMSLNEIKQCLKERGLSLRKLDD